MFKNKLRVVIKIVAHTLKNIAALLIKLHVLIISSVKKLFITELFPDLLNQFLKSTIIVGK